MTLSSPTPAVRWNPYEALTTDHRDVRAIFAHELPNDVCGLYSSKSDSLWVCSTLSGAKRECVLAHELVHRERGIFTDDPDEYEAEERAVEEVTARRMIPDADLYKVLLAQPGAGLNAWARALRVDRHTVAVRLLTMTPNERQVATTLAGRLPAIPELFSFDKPSGLPKTWAAK
jgi:hypothetical protein